MNLQIKNLQNKIKLNTRRVRQTMKTVARQLECQDHEISIVFTDDAGIQKLNQTYLGKNKPTNVLSFSLRENDYGDINPQILGDIVISVETAKKDAAKGGLTFAQEIDFLLIHGLLHLLGYNHENTTRAATRKMKKREEELFRLVCNKEID
ncbi:MAG TPA: rRNA maturation RNase YbeY [Smithellaceae bacterium]|nr:rRNA maturation RNase YbeY [Smithellaceae bacterium]HRS89176.1 rRNA maturation RNase YbeY [Smithellaceae bacterium]HRV26100.1 rRNA maturation RNase YbeY [Smithellaceae bacterium]